jgi:hypothetical protein
MRSVGQGEEGRQHLPSQLQPCAVAGAQSLISCSRSIPLAVPVQCSSQHTVQLFPVHSTCCSGPVQLPAHRSAVPGPFHLLFRSSAAPSTPFNCSRSSAAPSTPFSCSRSIPLAVPVKCSSQLWPLAHPMASTSPLTSSPSVPHVIPSVTLGST